MLCIKGRNKNKESLAWKKQCHWWKIPPIWTQSLDADIGACATILDLSKNTLKYINIIEKMCAPEHWHVLTPSDTQFQPHLTNKTALPAVSSLKRSLDLDLLPDWESQEVSE